MSDKVKVLAREPADKWKKENIVHLIMETDGVNHAWCSPNEKYPREGIERRDYSWVVREYKLDVDSLCAHCKIKRDALSQAISPLLPVMPTPQEVKAAEWERKRAAWLDTGK